MSDSDRELDDEDGDEKLYLPKDATWIHAQTFLAHRYTQGDAARLLHYHRGAFYSFTAGTHYRELRIEPLERELYEFFADPRVIAVTKKGEMEPFNPNPSKIRAITHALRRLALIPASVDAPCWLGDDAPARDVIVVGNGILDLQRRTLVPHTPALFTTTILPCDYSASAECPRFDTFLTEVWGQDKDCSNTLQEVFGYLLSCDTSQEKIFLIVGPSRGGKGTIVTVLTALLGTENVTFQQPASLGREFGRWPLIDKNSCGGGRCSGVVILCSQRREPNTCNA